MTKEEAEKRMSEYKPRPFGMCPAIRGECKVSCVSYRKQRMVGAGNVWHIRDAYCSSPLVTGEIECNYG